MIFLRKGEFKKMTRPHSMLGQAAGHTQRDNKQCVPKQDKYTAYPNYFQKLFLNPSLEKILRIVQKNNICHLTYLSILFHFS